MTARTCKNAGCGRPARERGMCGPCYCKWWRRTDPHGAIAARPECRIDGCGKQATGLGLCKMHYTRWWRHGSTEYRNRPWTPREDAEVLALPTNPRSGHVKRGYRKDVALMLDRSPEAVGMRRVVLLRAMKEAENARIVGGDSDLRRFDADSPPRATA